MKISMLIERTTAEMKGLYPGRKSQSNYIAGFKRLENFYRTSGIENYDTVISGRCVAEHRRQYDAGMTSESTYKCVRKASALIDMYLAYGELSWEKLQPWHMSRLSPDFERALIDYTAASRQRGLICDKTIKTYLNYMRKILAYYETQRIFTANEFTRENVNETVTTLSTAFPRSMDSAIIALKSFLLFAEENGIAVKGLAASLPRQTSPRKPIREGFTTDELNQMLASVDLTKPYGKRDYAILLLAIQTGLRGVDIVNLKFSGVCWNSMQIRIIQHKTRKPLVLPMSVEAGNAIAEYVLNNRPKSNSEYIFLRCVSPYTKLANGTTTDIAQKYMQVADITNSNTPLRGFHSIRRSLGARMLDSEIPLQMISEILGHTSPDSTKPYIAVHDDGLSRCALDLINLEVREGVLK